MKASLVVAVLLAVLATLVSGENPLKKEIFDKIEQCNKEYKVDDETILKMLKHEYLPESENEKCLVACVMKLLRVIKDGKLDVERALEINKRKYEGDDLPKANSIVRKCDETVPKQWSSDCEFTSALVRCFTKEAEAVQLSAPGF